MSSDAVFDADPNVWYHIGWDQDFNSSMHSTVIYTANQTGAVYLLNPSSDKSQESYEFQLFPSTRNASLYLIRPRMLNGDSCFGPVACPKKPDPDSECVKANFGVVPCTSDSGRWTVRQWGNSASYYIGDVGLGEGWAGAAYDNAGAPDGQTWLIAVKDKGNGSNIWLEYKTVLTGDPDTMKWSFQSVGWINDARFSTAATSSSTSAASVASSGHSQSMTINGIAPTAAASSVQSQGSSQGTRAVGAGMVAGAIIGGLAGFVVLAALMLAFCKRRRKCKPGKEEIGQEGADEKLADEVPAEARAEMAGTEVMAEARADGGAWEMPADGGK